MADNMKELEEQVAKNLWAEFCLAAHHPARIPWEEADEWARVLWRKRTRRLLSPLREVLEKWAGGKEDEPNEHGHYHGGFNKPGGCCGKYKGQCCL